MNFNNCNDSAIENCVNGSIRLTGGSVRSEGVVEICLDGVWGTLHVRYSLYFAKVVCRQLGFPRECKYIGSQELIIILNYELLLVT